MTAPNENPFQPPSSNVEVADTKRGSAVKAVIFGLLTDLGGTMVFGGLAAAVYGAYLGATGSTPDEATAVVAKFNYDSPFGLVVTIVGGLFSVLGGYVCARTARRNEYRLGLIMFGVSLVLVVLSADDETHPIVTAALTLATLAAIMAGIHLGVRKNRVGQRPPGP